MRKIRLDDLIDVLDMHQVARSHNRSFKSTDLLKSTAVLLRDMCHCSGLLS